MKKYLLQHPNGLQIEVEAEKPPTQADALEVFESQRQNAYINLAKNKRNVVKYETVKPTQTGLGGVSIEAKKVPVYEEQDVFLKRELSRALSVPQDQLELEKGAPWHIRYQTSFLQNMSDKTRILQREYGADNVKGINIGGKQTLLYREKPNSKWRFLDGRSRLEIADFTADLSGELLPTVASFVGGGAALSSGFGAGGTAGIAAASEFTIGSLQDIAARKIMDLDADLINTLERRGIQSSLSFAIDVGTMKAGKPLMGLIGRRYKATGEQMLDDLNKLADPLDIPATLRTSENILTRSQEIANEYPNSAISKFFQDTRTRIGSFVEERVGLSFQTPEASQNFLRTKFEELNAKFNADMNRISNSISNLDIKATGLKEAPTINANRKAKEAYQKELSQRVSGMGLREMQSPEAMGKSYQQQLLLNYVQKNARKNELYGTAYEMIGEIGTFGENVADIFTKFENEAILDAANEVMGFVNPSAMRQSGKAAEALMDIAAEPINFRQFNGIIQLLETKTKRNSMNAGFDANTYRRITDALRSERDKILKITSPETRKAWETAEAYYRNEFLPINEGKFYNQYKPRVGQSLADIRANPKNINKVSFAQGGELYLNSAVKNGSSVTQTLELSNNNPEIRNLLRDAFMQKHGLIAGQPIPNISFTPSDYDVVRNLWGKEKVGTFQKLQNFVNGRNEWETTFKDELLETMSAQSKAREAELFKLAGQKQSEEQALKTLQANNFVKLAKDGVIPLPENGVTFGLLGEKLLSLKPNDFKGFVQTVDNTGTPEMRMHLENAILYDLLRRSGNKSDVAQLANHGYQLWDGDSMKKLLDNSNIRSNLTSLFGEERISALTDWNNALRRVSVVRPEQQIDMRVGSTANDKGFALFFSNVVGTVKNRSMAAYLNFALKSDSFINKFVPALRKQPMSPEAFDDALLAVQKGLFFSERGLLGLYSQAEQDPEFSNWITGQYADVFGTQPEGQ